MVYIIHVSGLDITDHSPVGSFAHLLLGYAKTQGPPGSGWYYLYRPLPMGYRSSAHLVMGLSQINVRHT